MCGRYTVTAEIDELIEVFDAVVSPDLDLRLPRYNIAPTQEVAALVLAPEGRRLGSLRWGLVPFWADDPSIAAKLINARSETARQKPSFREAFERRRCLIPADGFFEWKAPDPESGTPKTPYWIHRPDRSPFTFAGLWERWRDPHGGRLHTCTILTTRANRWMSELHDRMPVVVAEADRDNWLSARTPAVEAERLLQPAPEDVFVAYPVSNWVNAPAHDDRICIEALGPPGPGA